MITMVSIRYIRMDYIYTHVHHTIGTLLLSIQICRYLSKNRYTYTLIYQSFYLLTCAIFFNFHSKFFNFRNVIASLNNSHKFYKIIEVGTHYLATNLRFIQTAMHLHNMLARYNLLKFT